MEVYNPRFLILMPRKYITRVNNTYENLLSAIEDFQQHGCGWLLNKLLALHLHLLEFDPFRATSYIPLHREVQNRKAVINIQNKDEKCFLWSVIAGLCFTDVQLRNLQRCTVA